MSLYLKYRPQDFKNLVGQSFVKNTLQKALENNKTVGAYLLCGPRGTGKTSTARILAKTINCENPKNGNPCLECSICRDFADERLIDIIEIDAASHTGVENIREIIERAQFSPTKTRYKIYIIDEVHMLSKGAFNALLKILEEPPSHVKFILATTETHKVPDTIISRCQRYDFKRISDEDMKSRLNHIAKQENINIEDKAINYIIKNSSGGMRNAISLFEQLVFDNEIKYERIVQQLEIVDENIIDEFLKKLLSRDSSVIDIFDKTISDGKNIKLFFKELMFYTKNKSLSLIKNNEDISRYINILDIIDDTYSKTKHSLDENTTFLIGILKILNNIENKKNINITEIKKNQATQINTSNQESKNIKESQISNDDLNDIFGESNTQNIELKVSKTKDNSSFNKDIFIEKLKNNGAKGALTFAIKGSDFNINGESLIINSKTKISKSQFENNDNIALITKSLNDMGFNNINIISN